MLAAVSILASCEKQIEFDPGEVTPAVVMISKPQSDSTVAVYLGYSRFFLDERRFFSIADASVTLSVNGVTQSGLYNPNYYSYYGWSSYGSTMDSLGAYLFSTKPAPGDTLSIEATIPGHEGNISASTVVPLRPQLTILDFVVDTVDENSYYSCKNFVYKIRFNIKCNSNREYFSLETLIPSSFSDAGGTVWDTTDLTTVYFRVSDPILNSTSVIEGIGGYLDGDDGGFSGTEMVFSSDKFTGGEHVFTLVFESYNCDSFEQYANLPVFFKVRSLSEELYRYNLTYDADEEFLSEPVQVYCNVNGGIGIFGASTSMIVRDFPAARFDNFNH